MSWDEFWLIFVTCAITMLACRVLPFFLLKGRKLPDEARRALNLIPPAAFAALVANDIFDPAMFDAGIWPAAAVLVASLFVILVACKTGSLVWSAITGVVVYALLLLI